MSSPEPSPEGPAPAPFTLPEPTLEEHCSFEAFFKGFSTGNRDGDLVLTLGVPPDQKYEAFPITDLQGQMVTIRVERRVLPSFTLPEPPDGE